MIPFDTLKSQTLTAREKIAGFARANAAKADVIPAGWNNNIRWHIGHLVVTPRRLTSLMLGEPLSLPEAYNGWFAKGTSPRDWGTAPVPPLEQLIGEMRTEMEKVFAEMQPRFAMSFPKAYETSVGIMLHSPGDALMMNYMHDGIHLAMLLALGRALKG